MAHACTFNCISCISLDAAAVVAALSTGRNCVHIVASDAEAKRAHTELNKLVMRREPAKTTEDWLVLSPPHDF